MPGAQTPRRKLAGYCVKSGERLSRWGDVGQAREVLRKAFAYRWSARGLQIIGLTDEEVLAIVDFMKSLTDPGTALDPTLLTVPDSVPSGLTPVFGVRAP